MIIFIKRDTEFIKVDCLESLDISTFIFFCEAGYSLELF